MISRRYVCDPVPHLLDHARTLVPQHHGHRIRNRPIDH
ncbi:hypothetical protein SRIMM317S_04792 [Streptomyces rimosus subsp. rimosus]